MSKELEALKRIGELKVGCHYENGATLVVDFLKDSCDYKIIETALKRLNYIDENKIYCTSENYLQDIKKLKALEIIKNKRVDVDYLIICIEENIEPLLFYNESCINLTREEYELLREILK